MKKAASWLEARLKYRFQDELLFQLALTHRSASKNNNERLEFLGDAVLDFVISEFVYRASSGYSEGDLSKLRASLVSDASLANLAQDLGLGKYLILGSGELKSGGHRRASILADALEAIFGAVYLDAGFDAARTVVERVYAEQLQNLPDVHDLRDAKTRLQERLQAHGHSLPIYELTGVAGADHEQQFTVLCTVAELSAVSNGTGSSRRKAEQRAAREMLRSLETST